jgi:hypothetical protein
MLEKAWMMTMSVSPPTTQHQLRRDKDCNAKNNKMKTLILICALICSGVCYSQDTRETNLILVIDEELVVGSIANMRIIDSKGIEIEATYYPGSLIFQKLDFENLISHDDSLVLAFDYFEFSGSRQRVYNYNFSFSRYWLQQQYLIMRVYNLTKKKYKKIFDPIEPGKNYTFELIHPKGQMMRKKLQKRR